jgi:hypothetical protein
MLVRTCRKHLEKDQKALKELQEKATAGKPHHDGTVSFFQSCISRTKESLEEVLGTGGIQDRLDEEVHSGLGASVVKLSPNVCLMSLSKHVEMDVPMPLAQLENRPTDLLENLPPQCSPVSETFKVLFDPTVSDSSDSDDDVRPSLAESDTSDTEDDALIDWESLKVAVDPLFEPPDCIKAMQRELLLDHKPLPKPSEPFVVEPLTASESLSLRHYIAWKNSNGTVRAYNEHRAVLQDATNMEVLSLYKVRKLALEIARLEPRKIDMCSKSCLAFTGPYAQEDTCPYVHPKTKVRCGEPRRRMTSGGKLRPKAQVTILPILPSIQAMLANVESSKTLQYCDECLKKVLKVAVEAKRYSDFANGSIHETQRRHFGLFKDGRDMALALSSDGAQLMMKKQSSTWILIIILLNLPPEMRYQSRNIIINFAIPGPNVPSDIESFIRPLFEELARASQGIWLWDRIRKEWFVHCTYIVAFLGDMLGSAKVNGMLGHSAIRGDRFSMIQGARTSLEKGSKPQYYPLNPPDTSPKQYNPYRPGYTATDLPMRSMEEYWSILDRLDKAATAAESLRISKQTGVAKIPLTASLQGFIHPAFFPIDPFHLFYENGMPWIWDVSTIHAKVGEAMRIPTDKLKSFGDHVVKAMRTLPPAFSGPVRDPFLKRQSQYKAFEWMAILHWYFLPIGLELEFNPKLLHVFSQFAYIVDYAMALEPRSESDLAQLRERIGLFLSQFERLYVGDDPEMIHRCRLCIFQLIHVPIHIKWFGSIRLGSQATCERTIGEMGHKIKSKKDPFANLTTIIVEQESARIVQLYHPDLNTSQSKSPQQRKTSVLYQALRFRPDETSNPLSAQSHILAIRALWNLPSLDVGSIERFGKAKLSNGRTLHSRISDETTAGPRLYRWFEVSRPLDTF